MKTLACWIALVLLLVPLHAWADTPPTPDYLLGPDDVLDITVDNHTDLNKSVTVLSDGSIAFPQVGVIQAAGKTPATLAAEIQAGLEKTLNNCDVVVAVKEVHSRRARITGGVKTPGVYDIKPGFRLMDLVALAGGLDTRPGRITGHLVRTGGALLTLDMAKALDQPDSPANVALHPDDLILLDEQDVQKQIHVLGEVTKPGPYDLVENTTLVSLISEAGPPTDKASLSKAYVLRGSTQIPMNLLPILEKNTTDPAITNFKLEPGDVLFVPTIEQRYAVLGQVNKPGYYLVSEKQPTTVLDALSLAGGQMNDGDLKKASVLRMVDGKPVSHPINMEDMLKKARLSNNVTLADGDILFIPSKSKGGFNLNGLYYGLAIFNLLGIPFKL